MGRARQQPPRTAVWGENAEPGGSHCVDRHRSTGDRRHHRRAARRRPALGRIGPGSSSAGVAGGSFCSGRFHVRASHISLILSEGSERTLERRPRAIDAIWLCGAPVGTGGNTGRGRRRGRNVGERGATVAAFVRVAPTAPHGTCAWRTSPPRRRGTASSPARSPSELQRDPSFRSSLARPV
jgi:hypothetical protein